MKTQPTGSKRGHPPGARARKLMAALLLPIVAACGGGSESDTSDDAAPEAGDPITLGHPGQLNPIWVATLAYVAEEFGFYARWDLDVEFRPLVSGGDNVQAAHTGEIDVGFTGTDPFLGGVVQGIKVTGIAGLDQIDWILVTRDPQVQSCEDMTGRSSGAMAPGDTRHLVLDLILDSCGVDIADVNTVDTGAGGDHVAPLVAGVLDTHVLHIDELAELRHLTDDDWRILRRLSDAVSVHYVTVVASNDVLEKRPEVIVRLLAAHIETIRFMHDPDNFDDLVPFLAEIVEQDDPDVVAEILREYLEMDWWQLDDIGLDRSVIESSIQTQLDLGNIPSAFDYDDAFDTRYWDEAFEMVEQRS
ncbi:ABC transporter substrate-binding protein [Phytoactinopolyspora limicola]|uniref:ABC transporter substrate-binding protein n=1 Tax=Phytoactinopolyspora limicola TaxID=2715536 RepID=UPI00140AA616|nr:ABC transporter substrate-binding protein [Phytoactinopolyspora limicola]